MQRKECHLLISHPKAILIFLGGFSARSHNSWYYLLSHKWQAQSLEWWGYSFVSCKVESEGFKDWLQNIFIQFKILTIMGFKTFKFTISSIFHVFLLISYRETCGQQESDFLVLWNFLVLNFFWTLLRVEKTCLIKATLWYWKLLSRTLLFLHSVLQGNMLLSSCLWHYQRKLLKVK